MRPLLVLLAISVLGACGGGDGNDGADIDAGRTGGGDKGSTTPIVFETVAKGAQGPTEAATVVARTEDDLRKAWRDAGGNEDDALSAAAGVDFSTQMVLAVFQGQQPTAGYDIEITGVSAGYAVAYTASTPAEGCITAQVLTAPFHLVAVPRSDAEVSFEVSDRTNPC